MKERWIANIGLCAAAGVFVASLSILTFQGGTMNSSDIRSLAPAQIPTGSSITSHADHAAVHGQETSSVDFDSHSL